MRKLFGRIVLFFVILAGLLTFSITAQAQTTSTTVPFTAEVSGKVTLPTSATLAAPAATTIKVPGMPAIQNGIAELQISSEYLKDGVDEVNRALVRIETKVDGLTAHPTPTKSDDGKVDWWWLLIVALLAWVLGWASRGGHHDCPGARIEGPLVQGPLVTLPPQSDKGKGGSDVSDPWLVMDHLPDGANITFTRDRRPEKPTVPPPATPPGDKDTPGPGTETEA